jgi:phosphonate transport system ATP-binding protein
MLDVDDLVKVYPTGDRALDGVSTTIEGNTIVAMIGPSGAGKSTFVRCINRLVEPTSGQVWLDEVEITSLSKKELRQERRNMGMVFQEYGLVERLTVMENTLSGRLGYVGFWDSFRRNYSSEDIQQAYATLDRVGLSGMENKRVDELSGGQRQRVGIARAVVQNPKLLLVDEPTSSLDPESSKKVMDLLTEIAREEDIPVLINIHEVHLAEEFADRILGLSDGELVFEGSVEELTDDVKDRIYRGGEEIGTPESGAEAPQGVEAPASQTQLESNTEL